jgi:DNA-binding NarL/FixJ family response regulator
MTPNIRVLIVDDHLLIREAWKMILENFPGFEVVGLIENADDAYETSLRERPDVVLMDINLGDNSNGFDATERIVNSLPKTRVIGLSMHDDITLVKKMLSKGARGYLSKNISRAELLFGIHRVMEDDIYIAREIREKMLSAEIFDTGEGTLTNKEIEIVTLITRGLTSKEIAEKLFISVRTVETHRHNILKKLGLPNAAQLSVWAREKGYF